MHDRSRAERRGSGRLPNPRRVRGAIAIVAAVAVAALVAASLLLTGGGAKPSAKYGKLPSWLPKTTAPTDHLVTATAAHPRLAVEGDTVRVDLAHGQADVTIVGPQVPEEGKFPVPATSPCTFIVTLTRVSGDVCAPRERFHHSRGEQPSVPSPCLRSARWIDASHGQVRPDRHACAQGRPAHRGRSGALGASGRPAGQLVGLRRRNRLVL